MRRTKACPRAHNEQHSYGRAFRRNWLEQSHQIQWTTLLRTGFGRIFQKGLALFAALAVCLVVSASTLPILHSSNGPLINSDASGNRTNDSGALNNVSGNGNYWSYAPNSQTNARNLNFNSGNVNPLNNNNRSNGFSVRPCRAFDSLNACLFYTTMTYKYDQIHDLVCDAYLKAREHERGQKAQLAFEANQEDEVRWLTDELYSRSWTPGPLNWFVLLEPSVREVFAPQFRDRVVSHVLFNLIAPVFERYFIYDSFSCRTGKGTLVGIERFEHHIRSVTDNYRYDAYCLNGDITGYFMSIVRSRLHERIWEVMGSYKRRHPNELDYGFIEYLTNTFLFRDPLEGCVYKGNPNLQKLVLPSKSLRGKPEGVGIPIGDVLNQLNSNIYMDTADQFAKRILLLVHYLRYVDDIKAMHRDYNYLVYCRDELGEFLDKELSLTLHPRKTTITSILEEPNYFLGAAVKPYRRCVQNKAASRYCNYILDIEELLAKGTPLDLEQVIASLNSRLGYLYHFNEYKMTEKAILQAPHLREVFQFTPQYNKAIIKPIKP